MKAEILGINQRVLFGTGHTDNFMIVKVGDRQFQASIDDQTAQELISNYINNGGTVEVPNNQPAPPRSEAVQETWGKQAQVLEEDGEGNVVFGGVPIPESPPVTEPPAQVSKRSMHTTPLTSVPALTVQRDAYDYPVLVGSNVADALAVAGNTQEEDEVESI